MNRTLLTVENVSAAYRVRSGPLRRALFAAVEDVSFTVGEGESLGIVGESGSGKSTLAKVVCGLLPPTAGVVRLDGTAGDSRRREARRRWWRDVQLVFQDPYTSLNPAMSVGDIVAEPFRMWQGESRSTARSRAAEALERVGLGASSASARPAALSGGQRQRVSIARALAVSPRVIVLDESVSALDVSVQAQILKLLHELRRDENLTYIFISHDIGVIRLMCDDILVMHAGRIVERSSAEQLDIGDVSHDYTRSLLAAVPDPPGPVTEGPRT